MLSFFPKPRENVFLPKTIVKEMFHEIKISILSSLDMKLFHCLLDCIKVYSS